MNKKILVSIIILLVIIIIMESYALHCASKYIYYGDDAMPVDVFIHLFA